MSTEIPSAGSFDLPDVARSAARRRRDRELTRDGWVRRFVGSPPRLTEVTELYDALGREVLLDPIDPEELEERCRGCSVALALFRVVYTREGDG